VVIEKIIWLVCLEWNKIISLRKSATKMFSWFIPGYEPSCVLYPDKSWKNQFTIRKKPTQSVEATGINHKNINLLPWEGNYHRYMYHTVNPSSYPSFIPPATLYINYLILVFNEEFPVRSVEHNATCQGSRCNYHHLSLYPLSFYRFVVYVRKMQQLVGVNPAFFYNGLAFCVLICNKKTFIIWVHLGGFDQ
jgi:hypothetical protein